MAPRVIGNQQDPDVADLLEEQKRREIEAESGESEDHEDRIASGDSDTHITDSDEEETKQEEKA